VKAIAAGLVFLGLVLASASGVEAQGLQSHSVIYDVKPAKEDKDLYLEGTASFTLSRSCEGWALGEVFQLGWETGPSAGLKKLSDKADRLEDRLTVQESLDGRTLTYQTRLRQNARVTTATGKATLGAEPGKLLADLGRFKQESELPAGTLAPAAARAALLKALIADTQGKFEIRTVELLRFHKPIVQQFAQLPSHDLAIPRTLPKDLKTSDKDFAGGRTWAVLRRVADFNESGDELWLIHQSGAIVRQIIQRQGIKLLLEAREITLFPAPKCD
jgi:hypothetical protein